MTDTLVIAPGDTVTLKSGGPAMTVEGLHDAPHAISALIKQTGQMARVAWADAGGAVHESQFWLHMLVKKAEAAVAPSPAPAPALAASAPRGPVFTPDQRATQNAARAKAEADKEARENAENEREDA